MEMNTVCHIEFNVGDLDRAQAFYEGLFGWTFREFMGGSMRVFGIGDHHIGGLSKVDSVQAGTSPSVWIQVAELDAMVTKAQDLGGAILSGREEVPGVGYSALVQDPDGNPVGLVQYV